MTGPSDATWRLTQDAGNDGRGRLETAPVRGTEPTTSIDRVPGGIAFARAAAMPVSVASGDTPMPLSGLCRVSEGRPERFAAQRSGRYVVGYLCAMVAVGEYDDTPLVLGVDNHQAAKARRYPVLP